MTKNEVRPVRNVVFDLGGVLVDWNPRYALRALFGSDDVAMEDFLRDVCNHAWNERQDAGRPWADGEAELVRSHPAQADFIRAYRERWPEMLKGPIDGTVALLARLRGKGVPLYSITNWSAETFPVALARFEFLSWFKDIVVSGREKLLKPDPRIFELLLSRNGLRAEDGLFVDDVPANVEGARRVGFSAVLFVSPQQLEADLLERGLL